MFTTLRLFREADAGGITGSGRMTQNNNDWEGAGGDTSITSPMTETKKQEMIANAPGASAKKGIDPKELHNIEARLMVERQLQSEGKSDIGYLPSA